jgi:hypothetical protein
MSSQSCHNLVRSCFSGGKTCCPVNLLWAPTTIMQRTARSYSIGITCKHTYKALHRDFIAPIVHLNVFSVHVQVVILIVKDLTGIGVARVARDVIRQHQYDLTVWNPKALHSTVKRQGIRHVAVIVPVPGRAYQHSPVAGMITSVRTVSRCSHACCKQQKCKACAVPSPSHGGSGVHSCPGLGQRYILLLEGMVKRSKYTRAA